MLSLEEFEQVLIASERSEHTRRAYRFALQEFFSMYSEVTEMNINKYMMKMQERELAQLTRYVRYMAIRKYCKVSDIKINWEGIAKPKLSTEFQPSTFTPEEVAKVIESIENPALRTLFKLGYECCTRPAELCQLKREDVDLQNGKVRIRGLKGSRTAEIPISQDLVNDLRIHIQKRAAKPFDPLFVSKWRKSFDPNYLSSVVFKRVVRQVLGKKRAEEVNMHGWCRHSRITHLFQERSDSVDVNFISRHRSMAMTLRYTHLEAEDVKDRLGKKARPPWVHEQEVTENEEGGNNG